VTGEALLLEDLGDLGFVINGRGGAGGQDEGEEEALGHGGSVEETIKSRFA
jgi:hypothetical protein